MPFLVRAWKSHSSVWVSKYSPCLDVILSLTRSALSLPCPEDPAVSLLKGNELGFDVSLDVCAIGVAQAFDGTSVLSVARANV